MLLDEMKGALGIIGKMGALGVVALGFVGVSPVKNLGSLLVRPFVAVLPKPIRPGSQAVCESMLTMQATGMPG